MHHHRQTCDMKNIKVNSFPGRSNLFPSVKIIQNVIRQPLPGRAAERKVFANIWKVLITSNVLKYYFNFLLMSMLCTGNFVTGFLDHNFQFLSDVIKTWLHYTWKKTCAARTAKGSIKRCVKMSKANRFVLKVNVPHNFNELIWLFWLLFECTMH